MTLVPSSSRGSAFAGARLLRTSDQSIPNDVATAVSFDTVTFDTSGFYAGAQPTRLTVPAGLAGYYLVGGAGEFAATAAGSQCFWSIRVNGAVLDTQSTPPQGALDTPEGGCSTLWLAAVGDYFELKVSQDSGDALALKHFAGNELPTLWVARVG